MTSISFLCSKNVKSYELKLGSLIFCTVQNNESPIGKLDSGEHSELSSPQNSASSLECIGYNEQHENLHNNLESAETKNEDMGGEIESSQVVSDANSDKFLSPLCEAEAKSGLLFCDGNSKHDPLPKSEWTTDMVIESPNPLSRGRGSNSVITQVKHHKFVISAIIILCFCLPASATPEQCILNSSLAISQTFPQCFYDCGYDQQSSFELSQLFYFSFSVLFLLWYFRNFLTDYYINEGAGVPQAETDFEPEVENLISPTEAISLPQVSDSLLVAHKLSPMLCYLVYEKNEPSCTLDDDGAEESTTFTSSYFPLEPKQNTSATPETNIFLESVFSSEKSAIILAGLISNFLPSSSSIPLSDMTGPPIRTGVDVCLKFFTNTMDQPRKVTFAGNNSSSVILMEKPISRVYNAVYLHSSYPRYLIPASSALTNSPSPKPRPSKVIIEFGCGVFSGTKTFGCMVEQDDMIDCKLELIPLTDSDDDADTLFISEIERGEFSCHDLLHVEIKPFLDRYGEDF